MFGSSARPVLERAFSMLFDYTLVQLDAAMFSLIAFYIFLGGVPGVPHPIRRGEHPDVHGDAGDDWRRAAGRVYQLHPAGAA
jgi:hypothetical protein